LSSEGCRPRAVFKVGGVGRAGQRHRLSRHEVDDVLRHPLRLLPRQVVAGLLVGLLLRARQCPPQQLLACRGQERVLVAP
jgi:hypothetical protein